jgi:hypothetical protein
MRSDSRSTLITEFPELTNEDIVLQKEVYAHFGLAFFKFALVEHSLINIFVFISVGQKIQSREIRNRSDWEASFDQAYAKAVSLTFGNLVKTALAAPEFSDSAEVLLEIKRLRDYFAHHFMRDEAGYFESEDGCWLLLERIAEVRFKIINVEEMLKARFSLLVKRIGIPQPTEIQIESLLDEYRQEFTTKLASGDPRVGWEDDAL